MPMSYRAPIELAPYSPQWNSLFAARRSVLASVFLRGPFRIEHTGRTAVTGLGAKPVIDVLIGGHSLAEFEARIPAAAALEYQCVPEHEAAYYQGEFEAGRAIVTVNAGGRVAEASSILRDCGAYDMSGRATSGTSA